MSFQYLRDRRTEYAELPQSGYGALPELHDVSRKNSRLEHKQRVLQVIAATACEGGVVMKNKSALSLLSALIMVLGIVPHAGARQAPQSSKEDCEKVEMKIDSRSQPTATVENQSKPPWKKDTTDDKGNKGSTPAQPAEPSAPYHIVSSIELGVRGVSVNGNQNKYRSDLNYGPGFKIFDGSLMMKDNGGGGGPLFDQLMVNTFGWSNDPNRYLRVSAEKTKLYKFDANYRRFDYFNSLTNLALNQHISNTE